MFNKKLFLFGGLAVFMLALFVAVGAAMATTPGMALCGSSPTSPLGPLTVKKDVFCSDIPKLDLEH